MVPHHRRDDCPPDPDRVDAEVAAEAPVLGRNHRRAHFGWDSVVRQPLAEARPHRHQHLAVGGVDTDHLAEVRPLGEVRIARQISRGDGDRDDHREQAKQGGVGEGLDQSHRAYATSLALAWVNATIARQRDRKGKRRRQ